ncbi:MAG: hypothetical protein C4536_02350 [Actinobacteria bacterium]|jgi:hypothetical protein|nr:MAG: hypothetical protein C4536_02350 [Actinomycetota bacterium]
MNVFTGSKAKSLLLLLFFLCMAVIITWPLLPNISSSLYGNVGDSVTTVWSLKWFKEAAFSQGGSIWRFPQAAYPYGVKTSFSLAYFPLVPLFAYPHGETVLYNLIIIFFIALNGYVMFLLGRKLYGNAAAGMIMGLIYIFCPYAITRAKYHLSLVPIFIFPLLLYTLINLKQRFTTANKIKAFLAILLALNTHPYYVAMTLLLLAVLSVCYIARKIRAGLQGFRLDYRFLRTCALFVLLAFLITLALSYAQLTITRGDGATVGRSEGDLYTYAGHAWHYYTPSPNSTVFGDSVSQFVRDRISATNIEEFVLFLGFINMGLALIAILVWFARRWFKPAGRLAGDLEERASWVVPFALLTAAISFILTLPPTIKIAGATLYMPAWFISRLTTVIRVYARFGVLVFFSVTLLSGACIAFADKALHNLGSAGSRRWMLLRYPLLALLAVLVVCEFAEVGNAPLQEMYDRKPVYEEVEALPEDAVIVEYPFVASDEAYTGLYLWNAIFHGKDMLNGYGQGTEGESMRNCVLNVLDEKTPGLLAYMGADYVTLHKDLYEKGSAYSYPAGGVDLDALPAGYELLCEDGESALLGIDATRPDIVVIYEPGFSTVITPEFGNGWWLGAERKWLMRIDSLQERVVDISFRIFSVQGERTLDVDLGGGRVETYRIGEDAREIFIPGVRLEAGINEIHLGSDGDPTPYKDVYGGYDDKGVCFAMSFWYIR